MIELLAVLAITLVFVGMAAVSSVRAKKLESESTARVYAGVIQNYISEFNKKRTLGDLDCSEARWQSISAASANNLSQALLLLGGSLQQSGKFFFVNSQTGLVPSAEALRGYEVIFPSTSAGTVLVKSNGILLYP